MVSIYPMEGKQVKQSAIHQILQLEERIGRIIRGAKQFDYDPIAEILSISNGFQLFQGKVIDIDRKTESGSARGMATIEGTDNYQDQQL
ncbi:S-methyl thiohydantoin desulfurase domain-containing protein, partial [Virgibacillus salexigens]|uniref:S-methyl thiohydantoin desulfurase domain-containing protein n=1 Tax=Virgibacillus massiliensis TaxID=1462526 RepID=UPI003F830117